MIRIHSDERQAPYVARCGLQRRRVRRQRTYALDELAREEGARVDSGSVGGRGAVGNVIPEPLLDWAIENIRLRQFDLLQLRAAEVCVGLQSLELPALVLCEIAAHAFAPRECLVPFHKVWTIVTMVKHYHQQSE
jgi:hypothetical protein